MYSPILRTCLYPCLLDYCTNFEEPPAWGVEQTGEKYILITLPPEMQDLLNLFALCVFAVCNICYNHIARSNLCAQIVPVHSSETKILKTGYL